MKLGNYLWNTDWTFSLQQLHTTYDEMTAKKDSFEPAPLPHDWLIYHHEDLYMDGTGWYRKQFEWEKDEAQRVFVHFDGVYMDSQVFVNGHFAGEWKYGYSSFEIDMTPYLQDGVNEICVSVTYLSPNSRWYSGAGIYRNVWLNVRPECCYIVDGGIYTHSQESESGWAFTAQVELAFGTFQKEESDWTLGLELKEKTSGQSIWQEQIPVTDEKMKRTAELANVRVWDIEEPNCYTLYVSLWQGTQLMQQEWVTVGFRSFAFDSDRGFFLNHRHVKWNGVCEHHDLGCLGAAYNQTAMRRKFEVLKKMGVNAVRTSHNMPAPEWMELADEMGLLVLSEGFDMWERSKTTYDYARFFPEWYKKDVASWIRRDRNHPSVILWSIGNEIYDTHADAHGQDITRNLMREVELHDPCKNARVTIGSNFMPWENAQNCADIVKFAGYNYSEQYYAAHHQKHPDWIIYGSETGSVVQSRGIYHFPYKQSVLADEDEQCSSLGNSTTSWGAKNPEFCIITERDTEFSCGQFLWTGFDYIGEPTPYHTRNSYFGQIDTAGFPKDSYYVYQAEWTDYRDAPMVHVWPHWDFNEGQNIDVLVASNAPEVELFLNGISQGRRQIDHAHGTELTQHWILPYTRGTIRAVAYDSVGNVIASDEHTSFGEAVSLQVRPDKREILCDGEDLIFVEISALDALGNPVENAVNRVWVDVEGAGYLVGLDNGDSTDTDAYKGQSKKLFSGKLLAVVMAKKQAGEIYLRVRSQNLPEAAISLQAVRANWQEGKAEYVHASFREAERNEMAVRTIQLVSSQGTCLCADCPSTVVRAAILPENADDKEVTFSAVNDAGIECNFVKVEAQGNIAKITAVGDGDFRVRCTSKSGTDKVRVISQLEMHAEGLGVAFPSAYEFLSAGLYTYSKGTVGNGNERGVATARDGETQVGFTNIDFGSFGSDEVTVGIFALTDEPHQIQIWEGVPNEAGSSLIFDGFYQKPSIWNVYQDETFHLNKRLRGITGICFVLQQIVHIKGFVFTRQNKAFSKLRAIWCDKVYGDQFTVTQEQIREIGNNVTVEFHDMDFGEIGTDKITICGATSLPNQSIHVRFHSAEGEQKEIVEFRHGVESQTFSLPRMTGCWDVSFVFMPGSQFDFDSFQFQ